jgi:tetratricopeptide (TPR) repeat protein
MHPPLLLLALFLSAAPTPSGQALNTEGFRLYQAGRYPEALEKFEAAAQASPTLALAHYNVAATLGVLRKQGKICEYSAHRETILERLKRSIQLDPRRLARAREDADLDPIRDTLGWQGLLGRTPRKTADVPELLRRVTWSSLTATGLQARKTLTFPTTGEVVLDERAFDPERGDIVHRQEKGTYTLQGRALRLSFPNKPPLQGTLTPQGELQLGALGRFTDMPAECDA